MTPEALLARTAAGSVPAMYMPSGEGPYYTVAECAMAGQGVSQESWYAVRYSYAGDDTVRHALEGWLMDWSLLHRHRWSFRLRAPEHGALRIYDLVKLHMDEERHPSLFMTVREIHSIVLQIDDILWQKHLRPAYEDVRFCYLNWLANGLHGMRQWLQDDGGSPP